VTKFNRLDHVVFIGEDDEAYDYMKKRWPTQTVMVSAEELNMEDELAGAGDLANATYLSSYVSGGHPHEGQGFWKKARECVPHQERHRFEHLHEIGAIDSAVTQQCAA